MITIPCGACGHENKFDQPSPIHAGFSNLGFLYNEAGTCTLIWSSFDPAYTALVGNKHPWALEDSEQEALERALRPSPTGDRWLFSNPARCRTCGEPIKPPMVEDIHYLKYPGSVMADGTLKPHLI